MSKIYYRSTIGVLKITIVIVGCHIPIVNDSDSIGHLQIEKTLPKSQFIFFHSPVLYSILMDCISVFRQSGGYLPFIHQPLTSILPESGPHCTVGWVPHCHTLLTGWQRKSTNCKQNMIKNNTHQYWCHLVC